MTLASLFTSTSYLLAYALPLLFLSIPVTFAGAFLTLDRTRTFVSRPDAGYEGSIGHLVPFEKKRSRLRVQLQGGIGGVTGGYLCGLHASTFLALLIPATTSSPSLSSKSFVPVWLLPAILTASLGGRWRHAALLFYGIAGGATLALSACVVVHPSLITRIVLCSISVVLFTALALLPLERTQHAALRVSTAALGSFGIILAIALLAHVPAWSNVWERLWTKDSSEWGTSKEKGLSTVFCILFGAGTICDWFLRRRFGENPDQKWDSYLADYAANLPNSTDRAGVFHPLTSPLTKLLRKLHGHSPVPGTPPPFSDPESSTFLEEPKGLTPPPPYRPKLHKARSQYQAKGFPATEEPFESTLTSGKRPILMKKRNTASAITRIQGRRTREAVKFRPIVGEDLSSSDSENSDAEPAKGGRPLLHSHPSSAGLSSSGTTFAESASSEKQTSKIEGTKVAVTTVSGEKGSGNVPEYSDYEGDTLPATQQKRAARERAGWNPEFLRRHTSGSSRSLTTPSSGSDRGSGLTTLPPTPLRSVLATPSLIRAIDRVKQAQEAAYGFPSIVGPGNADITDTADKEGVRGEEEKSERWASFWKDVKAKAARG